MYSLQNVDASSSVTTLLNFIRSIISLPVFSASSKMLRTRAGSATPLSSTTIWLKGSPSVASSKSSQIVTKSSSPNEQQAQPLAIWMASIFPSESYFCCCTSFESMFTAATSFTTMPIRPSAFSSQCFNSVVFPVPRKPLSKTTGTLSDTLVSLSFVDASTRDDEARIHSLSAPPLSTCRRLRLKLPARRDKLPPSALVFQSLA
mmetsp:Transcript_102152/g.181433  ORF Transcript_102152/g.181433 Transcript_102152/m.181433 type:complete len:204 (-) Transcript_102152:151-762(-)